MGQDIALDVGLFGFLPFLHSESRPGYASVRSFPDGELSMVRNSKGLDPSFPGHPLFYLSGDSDRRPGRPL